MIFFITNGFHNRQFCTQYGGTRLKKTQLWKKPNSTRDSAEGAKLKGRKKGLNKKQTKAKVIRVV